MLISYAVGFNRGETFRVLKPNGTDWTNIAYAEFLSLGLFIVIASFIICCISLIINKIVLYTFMAMGLVTMIFIALNLGQSAAIILFAYIIGNIALLRGRSRLYVLSLGYFTFFYQFYNILVRTDASTPSTAGWLIAINILFAAPIFFAIYKVIPKQNRLEVAN
jgi:hypothetical protein